MKHLENHILKFCVLVACLGLLSGCASDPVAPQDELPALTQEDVASQAGIMAVAVSRIAPELVTFSGPEPGAKNVYEYSFGGDVTGTVTMDFRCGGYDGSPCSWETADWGRVYTAGTEGLALAPEFGTTVGLTLDLSGDIDQDNQTATNVGGFGTLTAGDYTGMWALFGVELGADGYPGAGALTFTSGAHEVVVTYDGDNVAEVTADGELIGTVNLDDGIFTEVE